MVVFTKPIEYTTSRSAADVMDAAPAQRRAMNRLFGVYMLVSATALLFPHHRAGWPLMLLLHIAAALLAFGLPPFQKVAAIAGRHRAAGLLADWYPLLLIPLLYGELAPLNLAVWNGAYFDELIQGWEAALFGGQPSYSFARALPFLWLSEPLHAAYIGYYLIIYGPPLILYLTGRKAEFRFAVFGLMLTFLVHYLFFIFFPVQGPRYIFPAPDGAIERGWFYQLSHMLLEAGSSQGAAFPSSHVGVSVAQTLLMIRLLPRLAPVLALLTIGLALGAVYGGFHYAIDAVCGAALGAMLIALTPQLRAVLGSPRSPA